MSRYLLIIASILILGSCDKGEYDDFIKASVDDTFTLEFSSNWSSGYHWVWTNNDSVSIADTTSLEFVPDDPDLNGSPGVEVWTFKALTTGDEILNFSYRRLGSMYSSDEETKSIRVRVK